MRPGIDKTAGSEATRSGSVHGERSRSGRATGPAAAALRVALLAPPWIPVPPPGYGGIEQVIAQLAGGLVRRGHDVALLAAPGSESDAEVIPVLESAHTRKIGETMIDVDHVGRALEIIDAARKRGRPFDIVP